MIHRLGEGSSGVVEKHRHTRTGKDLALKRIHANGIAEPQRKAILLELRTFNRCRNPHIVDFYGAFFHENSIHIGLEYMDAGALSSVLEIRGTVPEHLLANITWQVLDGLEYLHCEMHVIHRDIKPSNLLLSSSGVVKITDFGVSGELEDDLRESTGNLAGKQTWVGTIYYMSPERAQGHTYRYDSDMWSLGLTLYECLCGRFPYLETEASMKQLSFWELMRRIVEQEAPRLPVDAGYSPEVQDFFRDILQKEIKNRNSSAIMKIHAWLSKSASQAALAGWIEQSGVVGEPQATASATPSASSRGHPPRPASTSSTSPPKSCKSSSPPASSATLPGRPAQVAGDLDFVSVSPVRQLEPSESSPPHGDVTPMDRSVRSGANPFMSRFPSSELASATTPSDRPTCRGGDNPFSQFAPGSEAPSVPSSGSRSLRHAGENPFMLRGSSAGSVEAETPMGQSLRGGDNPFMVRGGPTSPGFDTASSPSTCGDGAPSLQRGLSGDTPMSQSLRGGENPFMQRSAREGYPA